MRSLTLLLAAAVGDRPQFFPHVVVWLLLVMLAMWLGVVLVTLTVAALGRMRRP